MPRESILRKAKGRAQPHVPYERACVIQKERPQKMSTRCLALVLETQRNSKGKKTENSSRDEEEE